MSLQEIFSQPLEVMFKRHKLSCHYLYYRMKKARKSKSVWMAMYEQVFEKYA